MRVMAAITFGVQLGFVVAVGLLGLYALQLYAINQDALTYIVGQGLWVSSLVHMLLLTDRAERR